MGKDIATNNLIEYEDVFADIVNVNILQEDYQLLPEDLEPMPTVTSYKDLDDELHKLLRDTMMRVKKLECCIAFIGFENQTGICNIMPVRDMGYNYTAYMAQIKRLVSENKKANNDAYTKVLHDNQKLLPVITYVLYYGADEWKAPLSLMDMLDLSDEQKAKWGSLIKDYPIHVIHMKNQPEAIRKQYKSDYRLIADYLAGENEEDVWERIRYDNTPLLHMEEVLDFIKAYSGDKRYEEAKNQYMLYSKEQKRKVNTMCGLMDMVVKEGLERGKTEGRAAGMAEGRAVGLAEGRAEGLAKGLTRGEIYGAIKSCKRFEKTEEETKQYIMEEYDLGTEEAEKYMKECWD